MRKSDADSNLIHTCYQFKVIDTSTKEVYRSGQFCYPAIIITGVRKCSTSAAYALLSEVPGSIQLKFKENCPFIGWRSIVDYFESMPQQIGPGECTEPRLHLNKLDWLVTFDFQADCLSMDAWTSPEIWRFVSSIWGFCVLTSQLQCYKNVDDFSFASLDATIAPPAGNFLRGQLLIYC